MTNRAEITSTSEGDDDGAAAARSETRRPVFRCSARDDEDDDRGEGNEGDASPQGYEVVIPDQDRSGEEGVDAAVVIPSNDERDGPPNNGAEEIQGHRCPRSSSSAKAPKSARAKGGKGRERPPPGHVYALREVLVTGRDEAAAEGDEEEEEDEEERRESAPPPSSEYGKKSGSHHPLPRVVTSRAVRTTEEVYRRLEGTGGGRHGEGTVLCSSEEPSRREAGSSARDPDGRFRAVELAPAKEPAGDAAAADEGDGSERTLSIEAVGASTLRKRMAEGPTRGFPTRGRTRRGDPRGLRGTNCPFVLDREDGGGGDLGEEADGAETGGGSDSRRKKKSRWRKLLGSLRRRLRGVLRRRGGEERGEEEDATAAVATGAARGRRRHGEDARGSRKSTSRGTGSASKTDAAAATRRPRIVMRDGAIDWEASDPDAGRGAAPSSTGTSFVAYSDGTATAPTKSAGTTIFGEESVVRNRIAPIEEMVCVDPSLGIYISESGLSADDCRSIIDVSESCASARGGWSSYTYAKQTLGCREEDRLAFAAARPVMTACATVRRHLTATEGGDDGGKDGKGEDGDVDDPPRHVTTRRLVLDAREPHVVKYDTSRTERQKLDMHTDKSEWTFLIALSEGRGGDYGGGGTYFQSLNATVHLQRGQMLIFRGKLRHCGVRIASGSRYLLVGFLVPQGQAKTPSPKGGGGGGGGGGVAI